MALTNLQRSMLERARASGAGTLGISLGDEACNFLIATIATDLGINQQFPELRGEGIDFFAVTPSSAGITVEASLHDLFERLVSIAPDADTYFSCLAALHRSRLKYSKILEYQPIPTMD